MLYQINRLYLNLITKKHIHQPNNTLVNLFSNYYGSFREKKSTSLLKHVLSMSMYAGISEIGLRSRIEVPVAKAFVGSSPTPRTKRPIPELFSRVMSTTQLLSTLFFCVLSRLIGSVFCCPECGWKGILYSHPNTKLVMGTYCPCCSDQR